MPLVSLIFYYPQIGGWALLTTDYKLAKQYISVIHARLQKGIKACKFILFRDESPEGQLCTRGQGHQRTSL